MNKCLVDNTTKLMCRGPITKITETSVYLISTLQKCVALLSQTQNLLAEQPAFTLEISPPIIQ